MPDPPGATSASSSSASSGVTAATAAAPLLRQGSSRKSTTAPLPRPPGPSQRRFAIRRSLRLFGKRKLLVGHEAIALDLSDENPDDGTPLATANLKRSFSHPPTSSALADAADAAAEAQALSDPSLDHPQPDHPRSARSSSYDGGGAPLAAANSPALGPAAAPKTDAASPGSLDGAPSKGKAPGRRWFFGPRPPGGPAGAPPPPSPEVHPLRPAADVPHSEVHAEADHLVTADSDSDLPSPIAVEPLDHQKWVHLKLDSTAGAPKRGPLFKWMPQPKAKTTPDADVAEEIEPLHDPDTDEEFAFVALHAGQEEPTGNAANANTPPPKKLWFRRPAPVLNMKLGESGAEGANGTNGTVSVHFGAAVGQLYITVVEGRGIQAKQPYVAVSLQGQMQRTAALPTSSPEWGTELAFNLFDVSADVHVAVYDQPRVRGSWCVGRVVIPFATLLTPSLLAPSGALADPVTRWYELYPPKRIRFNDDELGSKFIPGIRNIKGSGLPKPKKPLGYVKLQFQVLLCESLARLLFAPGWQAVGQENGPPIQRVLMKNNFLRCKKAFSLPHVVRILLEDLRSVWLVPSLMFWFCFVARPWQIPPTVLITLFVSGLVSRVRQQSLYDEITIWEENVEMEAEEGAAYRLQKYTQRVQDFQNMVGIWATAMERSGNVFNWSDPCVTGVAFTVLSLLTAALSLALVLLPVRYVTFLLSTGGYALAVHIHRKRLAKNRGRDRKLMEKLTLPRNPLGYFLGRVPDNMELTHRFIARLAQVDAEPPPLLPEVPESVKAEGGKANSRFGFRARSKEKDPPKEKEKAKREAMSPLTPEREEDASVAAPQIPHEEEERERPRFFGWDREKDKGEGKGKGKAKEGERDHAAEADGPPPTPAGRPAGAEAPQHGRSRSVAS
eukprot:EG_transcript_1503